MMPGKHPRRLGTNRNWMTSHEGWVQIEKKRGPRTKPWSRGGKGGKAWRDSQWGSCKKMEKSLTCDRDTFKGRGRRGTDPGFSKDVRVISDDDSSIMPLRSYLFINKLKFEETSNTAFPKWVQSLSSYLENNQENKPNKKKRERKDSKLPYFNLCWILNTSPVFYTKRSNFIS